MAAKAQIMLAIAVDDDPTHVARMLVGLPETDPRDSLRNLGKRIAAYAAGIKRSKFYLRVDSSNDAGTQDALESGTPTVTITFANAADGESMLRIGSVSFAWATSAANENQVTIGGDLATATTNLAAAITAHSKLAGIVEVVSVDTSTGVITLRVLGDTRFASLTYLATLDNSIAVSAASFDGDTTDSFVDATTVAELGLE